MHIVWTAFAEPLGRSRRNRGAFAAIKADGSVVTWGDSTRGGDSSSVANQLNSGVSKVYGNDNGFAAVKDDGSVVTWTNAPW